MNKKRLFLLLVVMILTTLIGGNVPVALSQAPEPQLKMVAIDAGAPGQVRKLAGMGLDIAAVRKGPAVEDEHGIPVQTYRVEAVVSRLDEKKLSSEGFSWSDVPGRGPVKKIGEPYDVYHSFDEPITGIRAQLRSLNATYPHIAQLKTVGHSIQKRPMLVMRLTNEKIKEDKPQVLFVGTHHAREWVATEMSMRLIKYLAANYGTDARVTQLLDSVEVWVMPVGNPDGYQYTFTNERLWRKNLRDNDGDGQTTLADGVDINRNFAAHWGLDDEGSSPNPSSATYRGTAPNSEPETQALADFIQDNDFKFILSYHTSGNLILYPWGWQVQTTSLDDPIFVAQAGTDDNPAIWDTTVDPPVPYDPGVGADLYITNGDFTDWAYYDLGIPAQTVELTDGYGFTFPDDDAMVQNVFNDNLEFALSYAESALDPAHPVSPVGIETEDVYHTPMTVSNGPDQIVEVLARKGLDLTLTYSVNGGPDQTASFTEKLGAIYNDRPGTYYSRYEAVIGGQSAGANVSYQIAWDGGGLGPYSYNVNNASGNPILVVAAEDYSGGYNYPGYIYNDQPNYLHYYTDALGASGRAYDVWDVDAQGVPTYAEVLSHYDAAIWYTGNDWAPTVPDRLTPYWDETLNFREFINYDDGKLFATGQSLGHLSTHYTNYSDDFLQYYLGSFLNLENAAMDPASGLPFDVKGEDVFSGLNFNLYGGDGANNQGWADSFLKTSYFLPQFDNEIMARYDRPGGPFDPHSGSYYVYSQMADRAFKRLGGTFTLPAGSPTLKFWVSYDIESNWDYAFVEINEVGTDTWTTLPDQNGMSGTDTGLSCTSSGSWVNDLHPFLTHYMTFSPGPPPSCTSTGTTGSWNAFTANSAGWQQVEMDLSAYAGKTVELYISYATDWNTQGLGVFVDDIELSGYPLEDFEAGMGMWTVSVAPGSGAFNNWAHVTGAGFPEGPAIRAPNSVYFGFGFEAIDTPENRSAVMDRVMSYLGQ